MDAGRDPLLCLMHESDLHGWGIRLGLGEGDSPAYALPERGVLVIGPPRSGKTSSIVVPNVLAAGGPVVSASTKPDVLAATAAARSRIGECMLFDPSGRSDVPDGVRRVAWSPLGSSLEWDGANQMAETMVLVARPGANRGEAVHWTERAQALLAPAFHAAALDGMEMERLLYLVNRREGRELVAILARSDAEIALSTLEGVLRTEDREQSGIWSTASSVLAGYRSEQAVRSASGTSLDFDVFTRGTGTLYVCSPSEVQQNCAPLVAGLLRDARAAGYRSHAASCLGHAAGRPPLLLVLDELANIAPLPDLPSLVAEGGSQGVVTLASLQDLSQAVDRWGRLGEGLLSLFNTKLIFAGVGDTRTLEAISVLAGDRQVPSLSVTKGSRVPGLLGVLGRYSPPRTTCSTRTERRLPPDLIARGVEGHLLCIDGATPSFVRSVAWFDHPLIAAAATVRREPTFRSRQRVREASGRRR